MYHVRLGRRAAAVVVGLGVSLLSATAADYSWNGTSGEWTNGFLWGQGTDTVFPGSGPGDQAWLTNAVPGGYVNVLDASLANSLNLLTLSNSAGEARLVVTNGSLTTSGTLTMSLGARLQVDAGGIVNSSGLLTMAGPAAGILLNDGGQFNTLAVNIGASNNTVTVLTNAVWNMGAQALVVGAQVNGGRTFGNVLTVDGGLLTNAGTLTIGDNASLLGPLGHSNQMFISNGGKVFSGGASIGGRYDSNDLVQISDTGSVWTIVGHLTMTSFAANGGDMNALVISNGAVLNVMAITLNSAANSIVVTGPGSLLSGLFITLGTGDFGSNSMVIADGAIVVNSSTGGIGTGLGHGANNGNSVLVTGPGSVYSNLTAGGGNGFAIGGQSSANSSYNSLIVSNGALFHAFTVNLGIGGPCSNNLVKVTGAGSVFTNKANLVVGQQGGGNLFEVLDGAHSFNSLVTIGNINSNNMVLVSDPGTVWQSGAIRIGGLSFNTGNQLLVSNGAEIISGAISVGNAVSAIDNRLVVSDVSTVTASSVTVYPTNMALLAGGVINGPFLNLGITVISDGQTVTFNGSSFSNGPSATLDNNSGWLVVAGSNAVFTLGNGPNVSTFRFDGGTLQFNGVSGDTFNLASPDLGHSFAATNHNYFIGNLAGPSSGGTLTLGGSAALYAGNVSFAAGSTLNLQGRTIYYAGLLETNGVIINFNGGQIIQLTNLPPVVAINLVAPITLPATVVNLQAQVSDDITPSEEITVEWSTVSGPGPVVFGNANLTDTTATFTTNGIYVLRLTASDGDLFGSNEVTVVVNTRPIVTVPPMVTSNQVATVGGHPVVPAGGTVTFSVSSTDADGNLLTCAWDFGDTFSSSECEPSHVFSNCGPHEVTSIVSDGIAPVTNTLVVSVACPFAEPVQLKMKSNFRPDRLESARLRGLIDLPEGFSLTNVSVSVDIAGIIVPFTLDKHGRAAHESSRIRFTHQRPTTNTLWHVRARLKGDWDATWQGAGLTNATVRDQAISVPVSLLFDTEAPESFFVDQPLQYDAVFNKSGTAK